MEKDRYAERRRQENAHDLKMAKFVAIPLVIVVAALLFHVASSCHSVSDWCSAGIWCVGCPIVFAWIIWGSIVENPF